MKTAILKLIASLVPKDKLGKKMIIFVISVVSGFIFLLCLPVVMMSSLGSSKPDLSDIDPNMFTEEQFIASLDSEQAARLNALKGVGAAIETEMINLGIADQTIKAQLIYLSFFENVQGFDANAYANLFKAAPDDAVLIDAINQNYGLNIVYEDYLRTYTFVMNSTVNPYMFSDPLTNNGADLAAWADNAFISGWGYMPGYFGDKNPDDRIRYCDNAGLMLGYLNYDPAGKTFTEAYDSVSYTVQGDLSTMPDVPGVGLFDGTKLGVYIGNGQVVYCDQDPGYVTKQAVSDGAWTSWCTFEGITYPQAVQDAIDALATTDTTYDSESSSDHQTESRGES